MRLNPYFLGLKMLRARRGFVMGFVVIFSLGLSFFLLIDNLSFFFKKDLQQNSREILEADIKIQSRRNFTVEESTWIEQTLPPQTKKAEIWSFFSMVSTAKHTQLVQIKAVSPTYPLVGEFKFAGDTNIASNQAHQGVWVPPEFNVKFEANLKDSIKIGNKSFPIQKKYLETPQKGLEFFNLGVKLYIPLDSLSQTGLLQKGSRIFKNRLFVIPDNYSLQDIKEKLEEKLTDPEINITTYSGQTDQLGLISDRIFSFLSLAALAAFFLSAIGAGHFFYRNLDSQKKQFAQFSLLGYSSKDLVIIGLIQNVVLAMVSALSAILICTALGHLATPLIYKWFDVSIPFTLSIRLITQALGVSCLTSLLFSLGPLKKVWNTHAGVLLHPNTQQNIDFKNKVTPFIIQGAYFYLLGFYTTSSYVQSGLFLGLTAMGLLVLSLVAFTLYFLLNKTRSRLGYGGKVVLGNYKFAWDRTLMTFCMLGLAVTLTEIVPALQKIILSELRAPKDLELPQYFMFDIQGEQYPLLVDSLANWDARMNTSSPMIRARLVLKNNQPIKKDLSEASTPEESSRQRFSNRGYNLSYRDSLSDSETITSGTLWQGGWDEASNKLPQISIENKFAARLNIHLMDTLEFDVQGVPISGVVTSLRRVRWASFQPNFFVLFQPGVLEIAPKTFIGTLPQMEKAKGYELEKQIVRAFPNVTIINLQDVIRKMLNLYSKMGYLVVTMSLLGMVIGLIILALLLYSIIQDTRKSTLLMLILGVPAAKILKWSFYEFTGLILGSALFGFLVAQLGVYVINQEFLELPWRFHTMGLVVVILGSGLCVSICMGYVWSLTKKGDLSLFFQSQR